MQTARYSTPLIGIDAVVLDTETTGLDAAKARIVQIGAVRIRGGILKESERLDRLVDPEMEIPPRVSEVHGIRNADLKGAPTFKALVPELEAFLGSALLIGHTIAYDLTVLRREYQLAESAWKEPRAIDIRLIARLIAPANAKHDLDGVCEALGIVVEGRHTAIGDAVATAKAFLAMVPILRGKGIRTLAELASALRSLADREVAAGGGLAGISLPAGADQTPTLARIDSFPYRHRVRDVMSAPPVTASPETTIREAVAALIQRKVSSLLVISPGRDSGIVTERDVLRAIAAHGSAALDQPLDNVATRPLLTIEDEAFVYRAIGRMDRLSIRHLGVVDRSGQPVGVLTTRNLLRHRASTALVLGDQIDSGPDVPAIARAWSQLPHMARMLLDEEVDARIVAAVISTEIGAATRRAAQLAEERLAARGMGPPPVPYALMILGSGGRGESLLAADQDNAIIYAAGEAGGPEDQWFETLGKEIASMLDAIGIHLCKGGVMASNAAWRMSRARWLATVDRWVSRQRPEDLLNVDIFFDAATVHGEAGLAEEIVAKAYATARHTPPFLVLLTEKSRQWSVPMSLFGKPKTDASGRFDLKLHGLLPLVSGARLLAIKHGIRARGTPERIREASAHGAMSAMDAERLIEAHRSIMGAVLAQQLLDAEQGVPLSPKVALGQQPPAMQKSLKDALGAIAMMRDLVLEGRA
jgi:DNA polymerase-3 subunit epsilon/CBS domain-containing protein